MAETIKYLDDVSLDYLIDKLMAKGFSALTAYPVGAYYWSSDPTDPGTLFGGKWEQIENKFVYAAPKGGAAGQTGGAATVALTAAQLAAHTHSTPNHVHHIGPHSHTIGEHTHKLGMYNSGSEAEGYGVDTYKDIGFQNRIMVTTGSSNDFSTKSGGSGSTGFSGEGDLVAGGGSTSGSTGSGQAHENMPPYITAYCWRRTA